MIGRRSLTGPPAAINTNQLNDEKNSLCTSSSQCYSGIGLQRDSRALFGDTS